MTHPIASKKRNRSNPVFIGSLTVIALLICFGLYYFGKSTTQEISTSKSVQDTAILKKDGQTNPSETTGKRLDQPTTLKIEAPATTTPSTPEEQLTDTGTTASSQTNLQDDTAATTAVDELNAFFTYLDKQSYIQALELPENTKNTFSTLVQELVVNPPVITGEADDLYTLLKNTAHFFRIIGGKNIQLLKAVAVNESAKLETLATHLFVVFNSPAVLEENFNVTLSETALYDYSCFLLNTMGGRLYMFRRDIELRMLVNYYSLLFADLAEKKGLNSHGINLKPFITGLIDEIEKHGQNLTMHDKYLKNLYLLEQERQ